MSAHEKINTDGGEWFRLVQENGDQLIDAPLPNMGECVEILRRDGTLDVALRVKGFVPECAWVWESPTGWIVPGHPILIAWRKLKD